MKQINYDDPFLKKNINTDLVELYNIDNHNKYIHDLYYNIDFSYNKTIIREIKKKYSSYKSQDKLKHKYDEEQHISFRYLIHPTSSIACKISLLFDCCFTHSSVMIRRSILDKVGLYSEKAK